MDDEVPNIELFSRVVMACPTVPGISDVCGALVKSKKTPSLQISLLPLYDIPVAIQSILVY